MHRYLFLAALGACATLPETARHHVADRAVRDLQCPREELTITQEFSGRFKVFGCGRKQTYNTSCDGLRCVVFSGDEGLTPWRDRPDPDSFRKP